MGTAGASATKKRPFLLQVEFGSLREAERAVSELDDRWPKYLTKPSQRGFSVSGFMTKESDEFLCFHMLPVYGNSPTGEQHSLDSTYLLICSIDFGRVLSLHGYSMFSYARGYLHGSTVFGEPIPDASFTVPSVLYVCFTLLYYVYFVLLPALRSQLAIWIPGCTIFWNTRDLGSEESDSHHGAACLGEDRRDDRNHPKSQHRKDQSGQIRRFDVFDFIF